jgi:hypothetical protein
MRLSFGLLSLGVLLFAGCAAQSGSVGGGSVVGNCMNPAGCEMKTESAKAGDCGCGSSCGCEMTKETPKAKGKKAPSGGGCGCGAK